MKLGEEADEPNPIVGIERLGEVAGVTIDKREHRQAVLRRHAMRRIAAAGSDRRHDKRMVRLLSEQ
jgi:hypothetical protein